MSSVKPFLRPSQVASMLGCTPARVYQLIAEGELPHARVGRAIRIPRGAWDAWLKEKTDAALETVRRGNTKERA